jgi:hypothetical protein
MSKRSLDETFATLREILFAHTDELVVTVDKPGDFQIASPAMQDRIGRPLFVAGVRTRKNYVSYYLMPVYAMPRLVERLSDGLKNRITGKACFTFTTIEPDQVRELSRLTRAGIIAFRDIPLPWAPPVKRDAVRRGRP